MNVAQNDIAPIQILDSSLHSMISIDKRKLENSKRRGLNFFRRNKKQSRSDSSLTCAGNSSSSLFLSSSQLLKKDNKTTTTTTTTKFNNSRKPKKSVRFDKFIEIKEYPMILGDNPSAEGVPIQIDWIPQSTRQEELNKFEKDRSCIRRKKDALVIPSIVRLSLVQRSSGLSSSEIEVALKEQHKAQKLRKQSIASMKWERLTEAFEKAHIKNLISKGKQNR